MPDEPEAIGLLALMLLHDSRRAARVDAEGGSCCWPTRTARAGTRRRSPRASGSSRAAGGSAGSAVPVQASIAVEHSRGSDWARIVWLYDELMAVAPSPIVALNRAVAVAERDGPEAGLALMDG